MSPRASTSIRSPSFSSCESEVKKIEPQYHQYQHRNYSKKLLKNQQQHDQAYCSHPYRRTRPSSIRRATSEHFSSTDATPRAKTKKQSQKFSSPVKFQHEKLTSRKTTDAPSPLPTVLDDMHLALSALSLASDLKSSLLTSLSTVKHPAEGTNLDEDESLRQNHRETIIGLYKLSIQTLDNAILLDNENAQNKQSENDEERPKLQNRMNMAKSELSDLVLLSSCHKKNSSPCSSIISTSSTFSIARMMNYMNCTSPSSIRKSDNVENFTPYVLKDSTKDEINERTFAMNDKNSAKQSPPSSNMSKDDDPLSSLACIDHQEISDDYLLADDIISQLQSVLLRQGPLINGKKEIVRNDSIMKRLSKPTISSVAHQKIDDCDSVHSGYSGSIRSRNSSKYSTTNSNQKQDKIIKKRNGFVRRASMSRQENIDGTECCENSCISENSSIKTFTSYHSIDYVTYDDDYKQTVHSRKGTMEEVNNGTVVIIPSHQLTTVSDRKQSVDGHRPLGRRRQCSEPNNTKSISGSSSKTQLPRRNTTQDRYQEPHEQPNSPASRRSSKTTSSTISSRLLASTEASKAKASPKKKLRKERTVVNMFGEYDSQINDDRSEQSQREKFTTCKESIVIRMSSPPRPEIGNNAIKNSAKLKHNNKHSKKNISSNGSNSRLDRKVTPILVDKSSISGKLKNTTNNNAVRKMSFELKQPKQLSDRKIQNKAQLNYPKAKAKISCPAAKTTRTKTCTKAPLNTGRRKKKINDKKQNEKDELETFITSELLLPKKSLQLKWNDIAGLSNAKLAIQESVILPYLRPDLYTGMRTPPRGILLYGPPGTGKTMIARAAASESNLTFFACSASGLTSKWVGESEKLVRALFAVANQMGPSIIFMDELDSILSARGGGKEHESSRRLKTEFMVQVDGVRSNNKGSGSEFNDEEEQQINHVLVLGCSNCPWDLDEAVLRRFERRIYVPLPDEDARLSLINMMIKSEIHSLSQDDVWKLTKLTNGYSCSDLTSLGKEAAFGPLRSLGGLEEIQNANSDDLRPINFGDFDSAISKSGRRSVSSSMLKKYNTWEQEQNTR